MTAKNETPKQKIDRIVKETKFHVRSIFTHAHGTKVKEAKTPEASERLAIGIAETFLTAEDVSSDLATPQSIAIRVRKELFPRYEPKI